MDLQPQLPTELEIGPTENRVSVFQKVRAFAIAKRIPLYSTLELTLACNLKCTHCYNFDRSQPAPRERTANPLSTEELLAAIDSLADEGCLFLNFTGGEALLHPELISLVRHARKRSMVVRLKTNALLLTPERAKRLHDAGVSDVDVSVYGATPATHDGFTAVAGSFSKTLRGIQAARDAGILAKINFVLHRGCYSEVGEMRALADSLRVAHEISTELTSRYESAGKTAPTDHRLSLEQLEALYRGPLRDLAQGVPNQGSADDACGGIQCVCATMVCGISSAGEVYPCIGAPIPSGNLRKQPFREIWRESPVLNRIRGLRLADFKSCAGCGDRAYCQRSSGAMYVNTGEYTGREAYVCGEAALLRKLSEQKYSLPG